MKKKKILITGGLGFIGHHLSLYLAERGHQIKVADCFYHHITDQQYNDFIIERITLLKKKTIPLEIVDVRNSDRILKLIKDFEPDTLIHLAATANASLCHIDPNEGINMGLMSFCGVLDALKKLGANVHTIYFSSSMVYGNFQKTEMRENDSVDPINVYGASKLSCEILLKSYSRSYGIPFSIIRPSALYGERCINRRITQIFIENIMQGKGIKVVGSGQTLLDFTDIRDLCQGTSLVIENPTKSTNQTFNITFGNARCISDLLDILQKEFGKFSIEHIPENPTTPRRGTLVIDKVVELLGYAPCHPLESGYRDLIRWYKNQSL